MCQHRPIYERVIYSILMLDPKNFGFPGGTRPGYDVSTWQVLHRLQPFSGVHEAHPVPNSNDRNPTLRPGRPQMAQVSGFFFDHFTGSIQILKILKNLKIRHNIPTLPGRDVC